MVQFFSNCTTVFCTLVDSSLSWRRKIEAIKVHHLAPRSHEIFHERFFRVVTCIDFREGSELGVGTEEQIDTAGGPLEFARRAVTTFVDAVRSRLLLRPHV